MDEKTMTEFYKAVSDHLKHITTLSSGFVVIMAAFLKDIFPTPVWKGLVPVSFGAFALAIICSVAAQAFFVDYIRRPTEERTLNRRITDVATLGTWIFFLLGTLTLIVFAIRNFLTT
jgi:hypothetical protein